MIPSPFSKSRAAIFSAANNSNFLNRNFCGGQKKVMG